MSHLEHLADLPHYVYRVYPLEGRPTDRVWTSEGWQYPETSMFEEGQ